MARQNSFADGIGPGLALAVGRGGPEVCRGTSVQENLTTEASQCSLMDPWFLMFEWIKEVIYYDIFATHILDFVHFLSQDSHDS